MSTNDQILTIGLFWDMPLLTVERIHAAIKNYPKSSNDDFIMETIISRSTKAQMKKILPTIDMYNNIKDVLPEKLKGFPHPSMIAIKPAPSSPKENI